MWFRNFERVFHIIYYGDIILRASYFIQVDFAKELERNRLIYGVVKRPAAVADFPIK